MSDSIAASQDFLCSLTIDLSQKRGSSVPVAAAPLKVAAGVINGKELFAYPSNEADLAAIQEILVQFGRGGTGAFALYSRPVFLTNNASFYPAAGDTRDGRKLSRWEFAMPKETSRYAPRVLDKTVSLGYAGMFWVDPESDEITRVELRSDPPTPEMGLTAIVQTLDYSRTNIAGASVFVPVSSILTLQEPGASETRIVIKYENCHRQFANAGVHFIEGVTVTTNTTSDLAAAAGKPLPPGLNLDVNLEDAIDERTISPGMKVAFRLSKDVKSGGNVILPKGTSIAGHVTRFSRESYRVGESLKEFYLIGLRLDNTEAGSDKYSVVANLETVGPTTIISTFLPYSQDPGKWGLYTEIRDQVSFPRQTPGDSILGLVRPYLRVPPRLRMVFHTVADGPG